MTKHYNMYFLKYVDVHNNSLSQYNSFISNLLHVCALLHGCVCNKQSVCCAPTYVGAYYYLDNAPLK